MTFNVVLAAMAFAGLAVGMATTAHATPVDIVISGAKPTGKVFGEIFGDAVSFKAKEKPVARFALDLHGAAQARTTLALPPGRYVAALFQDTKGTGKLESNFFGVPSVPYGFSNNARGTMGPPAFDAAAFDVGSSPETVSIELR